MGKASEKNKKNTIQMVLVGPSGVGKSCLLHRYQHNQFVVNSAPTLGAAYLETQIQVQLSKKQAEAMKLQLWDLSGEAKYHEVRQHFYNNKDVYLVVFDLTNKQSFLDCVPYIETIQCLNKNSTVVLLGVRSHDPKQYAISKTEINKITQHFNIAYLHASAETGLNVHDVFQTAAVVHCLNQSTARAKSIFSQKLLWGGFIGVCVIVIALLSGGFVPAIALGMLSVSVSMTFIIVLGALVVAAIAGFVFGASFSNLLSRNRPPETNRDLFHSENSSTKDICTQLGIDISTIPIVEEAAQFRMATIQNEVTPSKQWVPQVSTALRR